MLTSPVNVTIAAASGAGPKANTAASDHHARREPPAPPALPGQPAEMVIEPELPSNSPINHVNAVAATVGNRTVLQELTLNIGAMLRLVRKPDETLTSLFLRIIATIEAMPQAERLAFEIRAGLKPLKITLSDLLMALRKPDGPEAARLTAMAEAPAAVPGRAAASAATTTYLEEGTDNGHTEETLAMRAAARNSAAGQSVFSAESKVRAEAPPADAKLLQTQLKSLFEPGEIGKATNAETIPAGDAEPSADDAEAPSAEIRPVPLRQAGDMREPITISSANLKLDPPMVEKIRNVAQTIANQATESARSDADRVASEKAEPGERRVQTLLTLKGLAEAVTAIPAKAAELLAGVVAEAAAALPEPDDTADVGEPVTPAPAAENTDETELPELAAATDAIVTETTPELPAAQEITAEAQPDETTLADGTAEEQAGAPATADPHEAVIAERPLPGRPDLAQHAVPFAYVQVQPAREEMTATVEEEETRDGEQDEDGEEGDESGERRRPRDEYDAIHDPVPEDEPAIVINRDSSEADRAFALYQRMGGF